MVKNLIFIIVGVLVAGCGKSKEEKTEYEYYSDPQNVFRVFPEGLSEPGQYVVHALWPEDPTSEGFTVTKSSLRKKTQNYTGRVNSWTDSDVLPGEEVTYVLQRSVGGKLIEVAKASLQVPRDLVIAGSIASAQLESIPVFGRIFFKSGAVITTHGEVLRLTANQVISEGALIRTFPEGQTAPAAGRSGGSIRVKAQRATGQLTIQLFGEHGAAGTPGTNGQPGGPGTNGRRCQNGGIGGTGTDGGAGGAGQAGGNSGFASVEISESSPHFHVNFIAKFGSGGSGGPGGQGGPGGPGGEPGHAGSGGDLPRGRDWIGKIRVQSFCDVGDTSRGAAGSSGHAGANGPPGPDGKIEGYCFINGNTRTGQCSENRSAK